MNLSTQEKKLFFNVAVIIIAIIFIGFSYWGISSLTQYWRDSSIRHDQEIIKQYEAKIDSINNENTKLITTIKTLDHKVDSLKNLKSIIYWKHAQEINSINDASAANHAKWLDTVLIKLKNNKK